jgi:hypothetical protein
MTDSMMADIAPPAAKSNHTSRQFDRWSIESWEKEEATTTTHSRPVI